MENKGNFSVYVPLKGADYFTAVRLAVGGVCSMAGADMDAAEDFKVCVTEALLILKRGGAKGASVSFSIEDGIRAIVLCEGRGAAESAQEENEISIALLGALIDGVTYSDDDGGICRIELYKSV